MHPPVIDYYQETVHFYNKTTGEVFSSKRVGDFSEMIGKNRNQWEQISEKEHNYLLVHVSGLSFEYRLD